MSTSLPPDQRVAYHRMHPSDYGGPVHYELWATLFISSMVSGAALVLLLAGHRSKEPLAFLGGLASIGLSTWAITVLVDAYGRFEIGAYAGLLGAAAAAGGYGLASSLLPMYARRIPRVEVLEPVTAGDGRITVLLASPLEPENYSPPSVAEDLKELADAGLPEATMSIMPFLFAAQKARYRAAGGRSPSIRAARSLSERLEVLLDADVFRPVELVSCVGDDTLDAAVLRAAERGCTSVIVVSLSVGESYDLDRAKARVDLLRPQAAGVQIVYTPPLWGREELAEDIARRVWVAREEPHRTGVALIMHGQPESRERTHGAFDVHENAFCNRVRMLLTERGLPEANTRLCYLDWRDPDVTETIRHLAALGCARVIVMPACFPFESVTTILDLQVAVRQARVETHVHTLIMQPWGDDDAVAEVLAHVVRDAQNELATQ